MLLIKARVQGYRSIIDSGYFDVEQLKTILVGPNEAGKTALLQALQKLNPPKDIPLFDPLRDYPRSKYDADIQCKGIDPSKFTVVEGQFALTDSEKEDMPEGYKDIVFIWGRYLDNTTWSRLEKGVPKPRYQDIEKDLLRLAAHIKQNFDKTQNPDVTVTTQNPQQEFESVVQSLSQTSTLDNAIAQKLIVWMDKNIGYVTEGSQDETRYEKLKTSLLIPKTRLDVIEKCKSLLPKFVLFNNYFRVRPSIHLRHLADRINNNVLDDKQYDYGNICLLNLLGFTAEELSVAGTAAPQNQSADELKRYKDTLDKRDYRLNAASIRLTEEIKRVWNPNVDKGEASKLRLKADGQYLKVVVEDSLGVEVELDQRSEGFQWLVSFFIVFFSEAAGEHKNAILLLDEPGMSLHGLKQAEFRETLSRLSISNQTLYTTHSPFLVGANELDLVRVVEMLTRQEGTVVHTSVTAGDSAALLPLQEAFGYDLAQSLFIHQKNLVLEGLTDYWYLEAISELVGEAGFQAIDKKAALIPANCASKVVYYATILHAQNLQVVALLDSDAEGEHAAKQETLVNALGNKRILRTKDAYVGDVATPEIEDLLRETLIGIAKQNLGWDVEAKAKKQNSRPIVDLFSAEIKNGFSKYQLAKGFLRWARDHKLTDLTTTEQTASILLIERINKVLK